MTSRFFERNAEILEAKGSIPMWAIADQLGVHKNTLRNWMEREMPQEKKEMVIAAIAAIKQELAEVH
jgi:lambda repressor-like predicted transcriptional regulator